MSMHKSEALQADGLDLEPWLSRSLAKYMVQAGVPPSPEEQGLVKRMSRTWGYVVLCSNPSPAISWLWDVDKSSNLSLNV